MCGLLDLTAGVTQEEIHTGFLIRLPSELFALTFITRRIQPFLSLVDREVEFCANAFNRSPLLVEHFLFFVLCFVLFCSEEKSQLPGFELTSQRVTEGFEVTN